MRVETKEIIGINKIHARARVYARVTSRNIYVAMLKAYRNREDPLSSLYGHLDLMEIQMLDAMIAAHLQGYLRSILKAAATNMMKGLSLQDDVMLGPFDSAITFAKKRLDVSQNHINVLKARYGASAVLMTQSMGDAVEQKTKKAMREIIERNYHLKEGVQHLSKTMKKAINPWVVENIVRTQIQIAYGAGRWDANQDSAIQAILWGYEYVTAGDFRVRPEHEGLEGSRYPKEHPAWNSIWPPNGFSCRCQALEIYNDEPKRMKLKEFSTSKMIKGKLIEIGPDKGWAINHGQIYTSNIAKAKDEIQAIMPKGIKQGDLMYVTDRFGTTHEVAMQWVSSGPPTPSNLAKWHNEFSAITKKPAWMKRIDALVDKGETPIWKTAFWSPKRAEYFEIASKRVRGETISIIKPVPKVKQIAKIQIRAKTPERYVKEIKLGDMKATYKKEIEQAYVKLRESFPDISVEVEMKMLPTKMVANPAIAQAQTTWGHTKISFNETYFGARTNWSPRGIITRAHKSGFLENRNIGEMVQHEFGHSYMARLSKKEAIYRFYNANVKTKQFAAQLSKYAQVNPKEMFAEMFVQHVSGRPSALTRQLFTSLKMPVGKAKVL